MNRDELKIEADFIKTELWLYNNGDYAAANSDRSKWLSGQGLHVIAIAKPSMKKNNFVAHTAFDYDMSYDEVKKIYDKTDHNCGFHALNVSSFYSELENFITARKNVLDESKKSNEENTDPEALAVTNDIMLNLGEALEEAANLEMMMSMYENGNLQPEDL